MALAKNIAVKAELRLDRQQRLEPGRISGRMEKGLMNEP